MIAAFTVVAHAARAEPILLASFDAIERGAGAPETDERIQIVLRNAFFPHFEPVDLGDGYWWTSGQSGTAVFTSKNTESYDAIAERLTDGIDQFLTTLVLAPNGGAGGGFFESRRLGSSPDLIGNTLELIRLIVHDVTINPWESPVGGTQGIEWSVDMTYEFWGIPVPELDSAMLLVVGLVYTRRHLFARKSPHVLHKTALPMHGLIPLRRPRRIAGAFLRRSLLSESASCFCQRTPLLLLVSLVGNLSSNLCAYEQERQRDDFFTGIGASEKTLSFTGLPVATSSCVSVQVMIWGDFASSAKYCTGRFGFTPINSATVIDLDGVGGVNAESNIPADGKLLRTDAVTHCNPGFWFTFIFQIPKDDFNSQLNNGNLDFVFTIPSQSAPVDRICEACKLGCCAGSTDRKLGNCPSPLSRVWVKLIYNPAAYSTCPECEVASDCGSSVHECGALPYERGPGRPRSVRPRVYSHNP